MKPDEADDDRADDEHLDPFEGDPSAEPESPENEDATRIVPSDDATRIVPPDDATRIVPEAGNRGPSFRTNLPDPLRDEWEVIGELNSGSEADVLLVLERNGSGRRAVVKLYRVGYRPAHDDVQQRLAAASTEHVVRTISSFAEYRGTWYEVLEYCEFGSLADLIDREGPVVPESRVREVVTQLHAALGHLQSSEIDIVHRDLKPDNVLVRAEAPLDAVLADFGLAERLRDSTKLFVNENRTIAYAAPEQTHGDIGRPIDWWSLGMCTAELLLGAHPVTRQLGARPNAATMSRAIYDEPIPLDDVPGRWKALCQGLLTWDPKLRWGAEEVGGWLAGEDPEVHFTTARRRRGSGKVQAKFTFRGEIYDDRGLLAEALGEHWSDALRLLDPKLRRSPETERLASFLGQIGAADGMAILDERGSSEPRLARLRIALDDDCAPVVNGWFLNGTGLGELAATAVAEGTPSSLEAVAALYDLGILTCHASGQEAYEDWAELDHQWRRIAADLESRLGRLRRPSAQAALTEDARARTRAVILAALANPGDGQEVLRLGDVAAQDQDALAQPWFAELVRQSDGGAVPPLSRALTLSTMRRDAAEVTAAAREVERREREAEQARQEEARRARRRARAAQARAGVFRAIVQTLFVAVVAGIVIGALSLHVEEGGDDFLAALGAGTALYLAPALGAALVLQLLSIAIADSIHASTGRGNWSSAGASQLNFPRFITVLAVAGVVAYRVREDPSALPAAAAIWVLAAAVGTDVIGRLLSVGLGASRVAARPLRRTIAIAVGVGIGVAGYSGATSRSIEDVESVSRGLAASAQAETGGACQALQADRPNRPRGWLRGEARCTIASVEYRVLAFSIASASDEYAYSRAEALPSTDGSDCSAGRRSGEWKTSGKVRGKLYCYPSGGRARIEWSDQSRRLYHYASRPGPPIGLYRWFRSHGRGVIAPD